jgi:hypothetical protein
MSAAMGSGTETVDILVRLLDEGTDVSRPTKALVLENGLFKILPTASYRADDENWEFPPGSVVRVEKRKDESGEYLLAVK